MGSDFAEAGRLADHMDRSSPFGSLVEVQNRQKYNMKSWLTKTIESANVKVTKVELLMQRSQKQSRKYVFFPDRYEFWGLILRRKCVSDNVVESIKKTYNDPNFM
jgi:hypothetical protein